MEKLEQGSGDVMSLSLRVADGHHNWMNGDACL